MHNVATTGAAKRRREQLERADQRRRVEQTQGVRGRGLAGLTTHAVMGGPMNQRADQELEMAGAEVLRGLLTLTQTLTKLVTHVAKESK